MIEKGLYALLSGTAGVTALTSTRIFPNKAPQKADTPYIVYSRTGNDRRQCLNGPSKTKRATFSVTCVGEDYDEAKLVCAAVTAAIGDDGAYYTGTWDGKAVIGAYWDNDAEDFNPGLEKDDAGTHEIPMSLVVWYQTS
jgi:hypothetical protein